MASNKRKAWDEAQERGLIDEYVEYDDVTEKEILTIIAEADGEESVESLECMECGEEGIDRGDGVILCDKCYEEFGRVADPETFYDDEPEEEEESEEEEHEEEPEEEDIEEEEPIVPPPVEVPPVVVVKKAPVRKPKKYIKLTRNTSIDPIAVGTRVSFKCKAGSNIRTYAGDMSVGLVLGKRGGVKVYNGVLTKKIKKDIKLKKIIIVR